MEEKIIQITEGRDAGKTFLVMEMPCSKAEKWFARALCAMLPGDIPADVRDLAKTSSAAAFMRVMQAGLHSLKWETAEPLYDDLLPQIYVLPKGSAEARIQLKASNIDAHVQDFATMYRLRGAVLELSLGFSFGGKS